MKVIRWYPGHGYTLLHRQVPKADLGLDIARIHGQQVQPAPKAKCGHDNGGTFKQLRRQGHGRLHYQDREFTRANCQEPTDVQEYIHACGVHNGAMGRDRG